MTRPLFRRRPAVAAVILVAAAIVLPAPSMLAGARLALLAAAVATGLLIAGAFGTGAIPR